MKLIRLLKNDLAKESSEWVADKIISQEQAEKICQRYGADYDQSKRRSLAYFILLSLGYLFMGLAVIILIGNNWDEIPRALRMLSMIIITLGIQLLGLQRYKKNEEKSAAGIFFLGNIFYGASIILVAQIYHLGEHMPDGIFWWAIGSLPFAVLLINCWLMLFSLLLSLIWFFTETNLGFYPASFPIFIITSTAILIRGKQNSILFFATIFSFIIWLEYSLAYIWSDNYYFDFSSEHLAISIAIFILLYSFSVWLGNNTSSRTKDYGTLLSAWCTRFFLILLIVLSYEEIWISLINSDWFHVKSMVAVILVTIALSLWLVTSANKLQPLLIILFIFILSLFIVIIINDRSFAILYQVSYNILVIGWGIWLITHGIKNSVSQNFFIGVTIILLIALLRYIDLIGDYIGGAILFMIFSALLLCSAKFWRKYQLNDNNK